MLTAWWRVVTINQYYLLLIIELKKLQYKLSKFLSNHGLLTSNLLNFASEYPVFFSIVSNLMSTTVLKSLLEIQWTGTLDRHYRVVELPAFYRKSENQVILS